MLTESRGDATLSYSTEPKIVAEACLLVLKRIGKITQESSQTGTIAGKFSVSAFGNSVYINLRVSHSETGTELHIQTQRKEGFVTEGGAQKGLNLFLRELGKVESLNGKNNSGW